MANLCKNITDVEHLQEEVSNLLASRKEVRGKQEDPLINKLKEMRKALEDNEKIFYTKMGLNSNKPIESLNEFREKWLELNKDPGFCSMNTAANGFNELVSGIGSFETFKTDNMEVKIVGEFAQALRDELQPSIGSKLEKDAPLIFFDVLNEKIAQLASEATDNVFQFTLDEEKLKHDKNNQYTSYSYTKLLNSKSLQKFINENKRSLIIQPFSTIQKRSFPNAIKSIEIKDIYETGDNEVDITCAFQFKEPYEMNKKVRQRLFKEMGFSISEAGESLDSKKAIMAAFKNKLESTIKNEKLRSCVIYEFEKNQSRFDVNKSASSIKGFLGEVKAAAALDYLYGTSGVTQPTGNLKYLMEGFNTPVEIPIDLVFAEVGFQVKNYNISNNKYRATGDPGLKTALTRHFQLEEQASLLLEELFCAQVYNQPARFASQEYQGIYNKFDTLSSNAIEYIQDYSINTLKIERNFQALNSQELFNTKKNWYNTFFIINDQFIPGSAIIDSFIAELEGTSQGEEITSSISIELPKDPRLYSDTGKNDDEQFNLISNSIKAHYAIVLNLDTILRRALNRIGDSSFSIR